MSRIETTIRLILLGATLACSVPGREEYTRAVDKTVPLQSGGRVSIEHRFGDIVIHTHPKRTVVIHAQIHTSGPGRDEAEEFAKRVEILNEGSTGVAVRTHYPEGRHDFSYYVRYELTIPEDSPLEVRSSFGSVSVNGLKANGDIKTSHGAISFRDGKGVQRLEDSFGAIEVSGNAGDIAITNTNGEIRVSDCGPVAVKNAFGAVLIKNAAGNVTVENRNGAVTVDVAQGVQVKSSFGAVVLNTVSGPVQVDNQYGPVELNGIRGSVCQPVRIRTSYSAVLVHLRGNPNYEVAAKTSYSRIHTDFPLSVSGLLSRDSVHGKIGSGGCEMNLTSSYGPIQILRSGS